MNEDLHADFVSHFTEFLVKYGQLLECCEKCNMDIAGQHLINPSEELYLIAPSAVLAVVDVHGENFLVRFQNLLLARGSR